MQNRFIQIALIAFAIYASLAKLQAGNAQWDLSPASGDWLSSTNWTPGSVPNGSADTATFDLSNITDVTLTPFIEVNGITFTSNASAYTFTAAPDPLTNLAITGSGITNNSINTQSFFIGANDAGEYGTILFENSATAGSLTSFTTAGAATGGESGLLQFFSNSTAGSGTFTNSGGTATGAIGGVTQFSNNSTAANGTFINNGSAVSDAAGGGTTFFADNSTGANGNFTTNGGQADHAQGGQTLFYGQSTSGHAVFVTNGGIADNALGGFTSFGQFSSASGATFTTNGATTEGAEGGHVSFTDNATASGAVFTANGGTVYRAGAGHITFDLNAAATNCTFMLDGSGIGAQACWLSFGGNSTAKNSIFTVNGGPINASSGGRLQFFANSAASNDTITINGSAAAGAATGVAEFMNSATAGNSTLIANGGVDNGGHIYFYDFSDGGTARVEIFDNALFDVTSHNSSPLKIGSLEGNGTVWISYNTLAVGGNNLSTTFSGSIQDLGFVEARGSLTKNGTAILTLTGANTYSGTTTVNAGALAMNGSSESSTVVVNGGMFVANGSMPSVITATIGGGSLIVNGSMSGAITADGGTLAGSGQIGRAILNNTATLSPGNGSTGTLSVAGDLTFNVGSTYSVQLNGSGAGSQYDQTVVGGNVNVGKATLSVKLGSFSPAKGTTFTVINNTGGGAVINTFKNLKQKGKITVGKRVLQISYVGGDGNDVVLTTVK